MKKIIFSLGIIAAVISVVRLFSLNEMVAITDYPEKPFWSSYLEKTYWIALLGVSFVMISWARPSRRSRVKSNGADEMDELVASLNALRGSEGREEAIPAWSLRFHAPFGPKRHVTSWIGGLPSAPQDFVWPRCPEGKPMYFVAQIKLSDVKYDFGPRPNLPQTGAMLVFITTRA